MNGNYTNSAGARLESSLDKVGSNASAMAGLKTYLSLHLRTWKFSRFTKSTTVTATCLFAICTVLIVTIVLLPLTNDGSARVESSCSDSKSTGDARSVKILLVCYARSGSTYAYRALQVYPLTFSTYEPLYSFKQGCTLEPREARQMLNTTDIVDIITNIFNCNYERLSFVMNDKPQFYRTNDMAIRSLDLWPGAAYIPTVVNSVCRSSFVNLVKTIRIDFDVVEMLMDRHPDMDVRIVHLVRDPRGILSSRANIDVFRFAECVDADKLCTRIEQNLQKFNFLRQKYPRNFLQVRYEDMYEDEVRTVRKILHFADLDIDNNIGKTMIRAFGYRAVKSSLANDTPPNLKYRNWLKHLSRERIFEIQNSCINVLNTLDYPVLYSG